ncbi:MAG: polysaccharide biosynthesis protein [Rhodospirillales bacterium]|nr:polysaccharide biosynthesis protein [Rhodospirillales bacterium]
MYRQIVLYLPSNIVPAICSFLLVVVYTRLLTPESFGVYSLAFSAVLVAQTALFYALPIAITRFHPGASLEGREVSFLKSAYTVFYAGAAVVAAIGFSLVTLLPMGSVSGAPALLVVPVLLARAAVSMNQAFNRSANRLGRYNTIECAHAVLGLVAGVALVLVLGPSAEAVMLGLLVAALTCALRDVRLLSLPLRRRDVPLDRGTVRHLLGYAWPLVMVAITASLLQLSDRFLLGGLGDAAMLGVYAVAYSLVERPMALICSAVSTATFSLAVQVMERDGREAGRIQAGRNGAVLLALTLPACAGLALTAPYVSAALVGPAFRDGVAALIPIMCVTALLHGVRSHFIDHAFHLSGRSSRMMWSYGPAAIANLVLNLVLIPRFGMFGAAWSGLVAQALAVIVGWSVGRRVFPLWVPLAEVGRIVGSVAVMAVVLSLVSFPLNGFGLIQAVALGGCAFLATALLLNVAGARDRLVWPRHRLRSP